MSEFKLNICHIYPDLLNLYGDTGNILCMKKRLECAEHVRHRDTRFGKVDGNLRRTEFAVKTLPVRLVVNDGHNFVPPF